MEKTQLFGTDNNPINLGGPKPIAEGTATLTTSATTFAAMLGGGTVLADAITAGATFITLDIASNDVRISWLGSVDVAAGAGQRFAKDPASPYAVNASNLNAATNPPKLAGQGGSATVHWALFA